jgi:gluconolactonase
MTDHSHPPDGGSDGELGDTVIPTDMMQPGLRRIVTESSRIEQIAGDLLFGEGPVWHSGESALYWVDILDDTIWKWSAPTGRGVVMRPSGRANGMTFDSRHRRVVAGWSSRNIWRAEQDGSVTALTDQVDDCKLNSPNDIVVKSDGSIWWTDPSGALFIPGMAGADVQRYRDDHPVYRRSPDGDGTSVVISELPYPNGLAFSPDESILYVADTWAKAVIAYDFDGDGNLAPRGRTFYELVGTEEGVADGMKVDVEGNVYVTGPAGIHVISPDGTLLGRLLFGHEHCTNMAWGDDDWRSLYVTTLTGLYRVRLGIPGVAVGPEVTA